MVNLPEVFKSAFENLSDLSIPNPLGSTSVGQTGPLKNSIQDVINLTHPKNVRELADSELPLARLVDSANLDAVLPTTTNGSVADSNRCEHPNLHCRPNFVRVLVDDLPILNGPCEPLAFQELLDFFCRNRRVRIAHVLVYLGAVEVFVQKNGCSFLNESSTESSYSK